MLNWMIAMRPLLNWFIFFLLLLPGLKPTSGIKYSSLTDILAQTSSPNVVIRMPTGGVALQGIVQITGNANPVGFQFFELAFSYHEDPARTWFLITEGTEPVRNAALAEWSTFSITDGDYDLRLRVVLEDGSILEDLVVGVRVRNYSQIETSTPQPTMTPSETPTPDLTALFTPSPTRTETPPPTNVPTGTPLPPNPAEFSTNAIVQTILRGAAGALAAFVLIEIYSSIRSPGKK
jgi:hypothetical protein